MQRTIIKIGSKKICVVLFIEIPFAFQPAGTYCGILIIIMLIIALFGTFVNSFAYTLLKKIVDFFEKENAPLIFLKKSGDCDFFAKFVKIKNDLRVGRRFFLFSSSTQYMPRTPL